MRVNVYSEELTDQVEKITREANGITYHGVRFYLKSPAALHTTSDDDDRSAVTFWAATEAELQALMNLARGAAQA